MRRADDELFDFPFLAGFECSDHLLADGRRLDLLGSTCHDRFALRDYTRMAALGIQACREGVSWVRSEPRARSYDFSCAARRLRAAQASGVHVLWDLMHFGYPAGVDLLSPAFPSRFGCYARAFARFLDAHGDGPVVITPINEISFFAWAGGEVGCMNPFALARGVELKAQLVRATIEAIEAVRSVIPGARFLQPEPLIQIVADPAHPRTFRRVECDNLLQYQAWEMLSGAVWPLLGGRASYLDLLGVNYYPDNQFMLDGTTIERGDARYRPLSSMLLEVHARYRRPMIISETGTEGEPRAAWLRYVCEQSLAAMRGGCPLHAITLYPILNHPGWNDDRHCHNGLWGYPDVDGERAVHLPLRGEILAQAPRLRAERGRLLQTPAPNPACEAPAQ